VVAAIEPSLLDVEIARAKAKPTESLEAYDYYLRALWERRTTAGADCMQATVLLRRAIELDPNFADALAALADCILDQKNRGLIEDADYANEEARQFAMRAVAAAPESGSVLAVAADTLLCSGDAPRALSLAERAVRALPGSAFVLNRCGKVYVHNGEYDKAAGYFEASLKINPRDPRGNDAYNGLTFAHFFARRFADAVYWARRMAAETVVQSPTRRFAAAALAHLGRLDEARAEIAEVLKLQPNSSLARSSQSSFAQDWMLDLYIDGLRKAGLPDD
jgi:adenylate cyclase